MNGPLEAVRVIEHAYLVARRLLEPESARDIAQETWLRWRRELDRGVAFTEERARAWVRAVAQNAALSLLRKARAGELAGEPLDPRGADPADLVAEAETEALEKEQLRALLRGLPREARRLLALRDLEGLAWEEVARVLGENPNTLRARHSRLTAELRARVRATGGVR